ncbi:hypothetical protein JZK55_14560 [Dissulfurispira thermophila]|uniref:Uncharacterized protein n=2 Tax=root TaxID=1 RepID=A0A7G1H194_9BACT|nr:hypothetical protein [Dissulfurispira thermophila]BCB96534.1 hypothetical protein JZK55_14560 [Dissulfurispira thermophila]
MFAEIEDFLNELKELTHKFLPDSEIEVVYKRIDKVSIRLLITRGLFIDVYANTETNRYDFSLIDNNIRISVTIILVVGTVTLLKIQKYILIAKFHL